MRLVVIDLIPALMQWQEPGEARFPEGAGEVLAELFSRYRLAAIADAGPTGADLRRVLDDQDIGGFFESIGTAADFGPAVSPRVLRRLISTVGVPIDQTAVVTGREELAEVLMRNRFSVIVTEGQDGLLGVPAALAAMESGRLTP